MPSFAHSLRTVLSLLAISLSLQIELRGVAAAPCPSVVARTIQVVPGVDVAARSGSQITNAVARQEINDLEARQNIPAEVAVTALDGVVKPYAG